MKNKSVIRQNVISIFCIAIIVTAVMLMVYFLRGMYPFGELTIAKSDLAQQFIPEDFYYLWDVLHGKANLFFTWQVGSGIDLFGVASHRAFLSPLNIFLFFSSRKNLLYYSDIMLIIKMVCVAISMFIYSGKYRVTCLFRVAGSVIYAFGAASVVYYTIYFPIDAAFILPLVMIGMDQIFTNESRKCRPLLFILICAYMLIIDIYSGFLTLMFLFLTGFLKSIFSDIELQKKKEQTLIFILSVFCAVMISAIISYPALMSILNSARNTAQTGLFQTYYNLLCAGQNEVEDKGVLLINMTFPIWLICRSLLYKRNDGKVFIYHRILDILLISSIFIPATELLWHGGSRIYFPVRYIYVISFALIDHMYVILAYTENDIEKADGNIVSISLLKFIKIAAGFILLGLAGFLVIRIWEFYIGCSFCNTLGNRTALVAIAVCMCGIYSLCLHFNKSRYLVYFIILEIVCSTTYIMTGDVDSAQYIKDSQVISDSLNEKDYTSGRIKNYDHSLNDDYAFVMGRTSIANYAHAIDKNLQPTFKNLGYSSAWTRLEDVGGTVFSDALLNYRYMIGTHDLNKELYDIRENIVTEGSDYQLYEPKYSLPFTIFDSEIMNRGFGSDLFENQNILYADLINENDKIITDVTGLVSGDTLLCRADGKCVLYMYCDEAYEGQVKLSVNGQNVKWNDKIYPSTFDNAIVNLGYFENKNIKIDIENINAEKNSGLHFGLLNLSKLQKLSDYETNAGKMTAMNYSGLEINIDYNALKNGYILIPIVYNNGWNCKVNGQNTVCISNYGFISIPVSTGNNHIKVCYRSPYLMIGGGITALGLVLGIFLIYAVRCEYRKLQCENAVYFIYRVSFIFVIIIMYIIPAFTYFLLYLY